MADKDHVVSRRKVLSAVGATGVASLAGCAGGDGGASNDGGNSGDSGDSGDGSDSESISAAWVYVAPVEDLGWSTAHDQGRQAVDEKFDWLTTDFTASVPPADAEQVFEQYASEGTDIIFGTSFGYQDPMYGVAEKYPDVTFEHATGFRTRENMGRYMGRIYQPRYLAGQAAGMVTETNTIGYVAAYPIAEVVRSINSMALGARSVNPDVTFKVRWINAWFDPQGSREAANSLLDEDCDVMAMEMDSPATVKAANEAGVWASGYNSPMGEFGGDKYLVSPVWEWEKFYEPTVQAVKDGTWEADAYWEGMPEGPATLDEFGPEVPQDVIDTVSSTRQEIIDGNLNVWEGSKFEGKSDEFLFQEMSSYVEGVEGTVPS